MSLEIKSTLTPSAKDIDFLEQGIYEEAKKKKGMRPNVPFGFFLKDEKGRTFGGLNGFCYYGCLYMDQLYIEEQYRAKGWGKKLVQAAEDFGHAQNCKIFHVTTMDWEARGFYEKLGYKLMISFEGYDNNAVMYFLRKEEKTPL